MDLRTWIYNAIKNDPAITNDLEVGDRVYQTLDEETPATKPFLVLRFDVDAHVIGDADAQDVVVWAHDYPGSYLRIDAILNRLHDLLSGPIVDQDGIAATWNGSSPDLADDERGTFVRNTGFRLYRRRRAA